ncbi:MAG: hypothetical protein ACKO21_11375 [Nodosilinea sp.]|jgi:hypothetical protein
MDVRPCQPPRCRRCRHYTPEGRRGGYCSLLGVPIQGGWEACSLWAPVFMSKIPELDPLELLPQPIEIHFPEPPLAPEPLPVPTLPIPGPVFASHR